MKNIFTIIFISAVTALITKFVIMGDDPAPLFLLADQIEQTVGSNLVLILFALVLLGFVYIIFNNPSFGRYKPKNLPSLNENLGAGEVPGKAEPREAGQDKD